MSKFALLAIALSGIAAPAVAEPAPAPAPENQQSAAKSAKEKKICKMMGEQEIGSRFGTDRVCKTAAEWKKLEEKPAKRN